MTSYNPIEDRVRKTGAELYALMGGAVPSLFDKGRWKGRLMQWAMRDEASKVQLFRFIDVLPGLKSDALVMRMMEEYFAGMADAPTMIMKGIARIAQRISAPGIAAAAIRSGAESFGRQFIAGHDPETVFGQIRGLRNEGMGFTLDVLGEAVLSDPEAREYRIRYLELLNYLAPKMADFADYPLIDRDDRGPIPRLELSLKVSSFFARLDPMDWDGSIEGTLAGLRPVLERAKLLGAGVTLDMEHYYLKDLTIALFKRMLTEFPELPRSGIVLQAYLRDTADDLRQLIDWVRLRGLRIGLRLVKGAYWDYETVMSLQRGWPCPVFLSKAETDRSYEELTRVLLENTVYVRPAIATHNIRSISHAAAAAESLKLPKSALEFQTIFGMAEPIRKALRQMGYRVRVYTPVGALIPGMAYLIRRLLENTSNESFLRKSFSEKTPFDELIRAPESGSPAGVSAGQGTGFRNEPLTDFSSADNRVRMTGALHEVKHAFGSRYPLIIGAEEVRTDREIQSVNPTQPEEVVGNVARATANDADWAVQIAEATWKTWRLTLPEQRAGYLTAVAEQMRRSRFELAALQVYEVGKTWPEADADVAEAIDFLEYYAGEMVRIAAPMPMGDLPGEGNLCVCEPKGVGVVISPWNFPLAIPTGMVAAALVTGNCVIFKPSSLSPVCGWKLVELFRRAGLPPGVLQFVPGDGQEIGEYLVSHPLVHFIALTGSKDAGLGVIRAAAVTHPEQRHVKSVIAEMGGKNAIIVDETADLDDAVKGVLQSAFGFQGQKCSACSRAIVVGRVADDFCHRLRKAVESVTIGPPEDPGSFMGPVVSEAALAKISHYIELGTREASTLVSMRVRHDGWFVGPAVFVDVNASSPLAQDEIFGPVLVILKARDFAEAIELANNTPYALTGGLFSRSPANIREAQASFRVGNLYINRKITGAMVGRQPFGGFGLSGVGSKAGGPDYLRQFMHVKSISENTMRRGFAPGTKARE